MGTSPAESMSSAANPPILTPITEYHRPSNDDETYETIPSKVNDTPKSQTQESKLQSINEVFDLMKSEITSAVSKTKNERNSTNSDLVNELVSVTTTDELTPKAVATKNDNIQVPKQTSSKRTVLEEHGFIIGNQIGSGTYAKVKVAYSTEHKGPVAVKIISKMKAPSEYLSRFLPREIEVVKGLRHENLIKFYQSIETTHRVYIIMQLAEKGSLLDLIRNAKQLNDVQARKYYQQLINAIEYCHSKGVVHRDIKCENLLLDKDSNLKLIDFGFARGEMFPINSTPVLSETYCGSYAYASPEVLKGVPYDPHMSDIWASGVVLYAMIYGHLPYDGSNYNHLLKQVQAKLSFPRHPTDVPSECKNLILKILAPLKFRYQIRQIKQDKWYSNKF